MTEVTEERNRLQVHNFMVKKKGKFKVKVRSGQMMEEQERSELQQREHKMRMAQMRKAMEDPVKEQDEMERWLQADKDNLALQLEEITRNMEMEKQCYETQPRNTETREALMRKEMEDLVIEIDEIKSKFQADKDSLVVRYEDMTRNIQKEKERYDHQQIEFKTREDQMREEMQTSVKEIDKMRETFQAEKNSLVLHLKEKGGNLEKEGSELQKQGIEARKAEMREDMESLVNDRDEMQTDRLVVQLEKKPRKLGKEKKRLELRQQETEAKGVHIRDEMEMLQNEIKQFQADKDSLVLQLQKEKERCEEMERSEELIRSYWIKHCGRIFQKEKKLDEITVEVEALKETVENLKQKARHMETEMMEGFNEVDKMLRYFVPWWFQKLREKKKKKKIRQDLKIEIDRLEVQLRISKANIVVVNEILKIERQLESDNFFPMQNIENEENQETYKFKESEKETIEKFMVNDESKDIIEKRWKKKWKRPNLWWRVIEDREAQMSDEPSLDEGFLSHRNKMMLKLEKERENRKKKPHQMVVVVQIHKTLEDEEREETVKHQ